jgi:hypothetical protein
VGDSEEVRPMGVETAIDPSTGTVQPALAGLGLDA